MTKKQVEKIIEYWQKTAKRDYDTMLGLFKIKRYPETLFFGHIVLEKILKALVVQNTKKGSPYTHDLFKLQKLAQVDLVKEQVDLLDEVNDFNIRARYPQHKLQFYKKCTKSYTANKLKQIIQIYKTSCQKLKPKK